MRRLSGIVAVSLLVVGGLSFSSESVQAANSNVPVVIGHAGGAKIAPENTVVGIHKEVEAGAPIVEVDVRWSANTNKETNPGYPVLMHDATVDRTTSGTGRVESLGLTALVNMAAQDYAPYNTDPQYANVKVPYAWDFFNASYQTGATLLLDVKITPGEWNMRKLIEYADKFPGGRERIIYMSSPASVTAAKSFFPDLNYIVIEYPAVGTLRTGESLVSLGVSGYAVPWDRISPAMVDYYHSYGLKVYSWTTDQESYDVEDNWSKLRAAGVDYLITNRVSEVLATQ